MLFFKNMRFEVGEMAQQLIALTALAQGLGTVPSTHRAADNPL